MTKIFSDECNIKRQLLSNNKTRYTLYQMELVSIKFPLIWEDHDFNLV